MTRQRALRLAREWAQGHKCTLRDGETAEYHSMFATMLEEAPSKETLTLEQLREMDGEPVWIVLVDERFRDLNGWYLVHHGNAYLARIDDWELDDDEYGLEWLAYRRPPEGEEGHHG